MATGLRLITRRLQNTNYHEYDRTVSYGIFETVSFNGSIFQSLTRNNFNNKLTDTKYWIKIF